MVRSTEEEKRAFEARIKVDKTPTVQAKDKQKAQFASKNANNSSNNGANTSRKLSRTGGRGNENYKEHGQGR